MAALGAAWGAGGGGGGAAVGPASLPPCEGASLADVRSIVLMLYDARTDAALRKRADRWLDDYRMRREAWAAADAFLTADVAAGGDAATAEQLVMFAAITMHHKIRYDFRELPEPMHVALRCVPRRACRPCRVLPACDAGAVLRHGSRARDSWSPH